MSKLNKKQQRHLIIKFNIDALGKKQFGEMVKKEIDKYLEDNTMLIPNLIGVYFQTITLSVKGLRRCMN